jgi:2-polyprenyl-6-methoxyphenol hydroxylase-like FAD-dependent oxidoreductase
MHVIGHDDLLGHDLPAVLGGDLLQQLPAAMLRAPHRVQTQGAHPGRCATKPALRHTPHLTKPNRQTRPIPPWSPAPTRPTAKAAGPLKVNWYGYFRQAAGPGWVLVGDAGHFKDFSPGQGIADALRQAERLAAAIEEGLGQSNLDTAMQRWWRWRDTDAYEMYWFATAMGAPGMAPVLIRGLLKDVANDPEATRMLRVLNHEVRPSQLMTPSRVARATARAMRDEPRQIASILGELITTGSQTLHQARLARTRPPGMTLPAWQAG